VESRPRLLAAKLGGNERKKRKRKLYGLATMKRKNYVIFPLLESRNRRQKKKEAVSVPDVCRKSNEESGLNSRSRPEKKKRSLRYQEKP